MIWILNTERNIRVYIYIYTLYYIYNTHIITFIFIYTSFMANILRVGTINCTSPFQIVNCIAFGLYPFAVPAFQRGQSPVKKRPRTTSFMELSIHFTVWSLPSKQILRLVLYLPKRSKSDVYMSCKFMKTYNYTKYTPHIDNNNTKTRRHKANPGHHSLRRCLNKDSGTKMSWRKDHEI